MYVEAPSTPYVRYLVKEANESSILIDLPKRVKPKIVRTPENIAFVAERVYEAPSTSIHRCPQQLNISGTSFRPWYDSIQSPIGSGVEAN